MGKQKTKQNSKQKPKGKTSGSANGQNVSLRKAQVPCSSTYGLVKLALKFHL